MLLTRKPRNYLLTEKQNFTPTPQKKTQWHNRYGKDLDTFFIVAMIRSPKLGEKNDSMDGNIQQTVYTIYKQYLSVSPSLYSYVTFYVYVWDKKNIMTEQFFLGSFLFYLMFPLISSNLFSTQLQ